MIKLKHILMDKSSFIYYSSIEAEMLKVQTILMKYLKYTEMFCKSLNI